MKVVFSDRQLAHAPETILSSGAEAPNPEVPERARLLLDAATGAGLERIEPADHGRELLAAVHSARYLEFLEHIHRRWQHVKDGSRYPMPNIHPHSQAAGYPASAAGQLGFHVYDGASPVSAETWDSAYWSAMSAIHAAQDVIDGSAACYALSRPPGHHAGFELVGGFCYLNNSALAAHVLRSRFERVAILDIDVHHGNGTQDIFYSRSDVFTVSLHADPVRFYPFFWGYANETGADDGEGFNLNLPLPRGTGDDEYVDALAGALDRIAEFRAGALVVALGLDAHESDPFQGLAITTRGFTRIAEKIANSRLPTVLVQEGGYLSDELGANLAAFLEPFL